MKKIYRLKRNEQIGKIVKLAQVIKNECFVFYYNFNCENDNIKICISTSKKLGIAVVRNKIRRQVREMINSIFDYNLKLDLVIVVRNNYLNHDFNYNKELLLESYNKLLSKENANEQK